MELGRTSMRLHDLVAQTAGPIDVCLPDGSRLKLPGAQKVAQAIMACPARYVLEDDVAGLCTRIAFEPESIVGACFDILRSPAQVFWLEWSSFEHIGELVRAGVVEPPLMSQRQLLGVLVRYERESAGTLDFVWESVESDGVELAPMRVEFDFADRSFWRRSDGLEAFGVAVDSHPSLAPLFERLRFRVDPEWRAYYEARTRDAARYRQVMHEVMRPLCSMAPLPFAFMLLLMTRRALQERPANLSRLNRARTMRGRPALLDHVEMRLALAAPLKEGGKGEGSARAKSRLHMVRGHLVRRQNAVFWRNAHLRGNSELGSVASRTTTFSLSGGSRATATTAATSGSGC